MKKVTLAIAMAALVLFAGCKKENETNGTIGTTLKASIVQPNGDGSKTSLNPSDGAIYWSQGDKFIASNGSGTAVFTLASAAGTTEGTFNSNGEFEVEETNVAVYPETATISGNTVSLTLPETQTLAAPGTFGDGANPMLAVFNDNNLTFTSICGGLGVKLTGDNVAITGIEIISANENDKLNGAFECTTAEPVLAPAADNAGTNHIMLNCNATLTTDAQTFFFVLPVGTLANGITMKVYNNTGVIFTKSTTSTQLEVVLNTVKVMNEITVVPEIEGTLVGMFTVNDEGKQVYFSQGNLQYQASTNTWRFAEHQYDYVGNANSSISQTNSGWIDLFGWGTSGYNHGAIAYQPWSTSTISEDYYAYGSYTNNLYDGNGQADWGYNAISNGGNTENSGWRTLSHSEWDYVIKTRNTTSGIRYVKGKVNGVKGMILLPDNWTASIYALNGINFGTSYNNNTISAEDWVNILEANGAVFLPAAGNRLSGTSVNTFNMGSIGQYWSASSIDTGTAGLMDFGSSTLGFGYCSRRAGESVRLVRDAN